MGDIPVLARARGSLSAWCGVELRERLDRRRNPGRLWSVVCIGRYSSHDGVHF